MTIQNAVDLANGELSRLFRISPIDLEPIWGGGCEEYKTVIHTGNASALQWHSGADGANMPVKYVRDDDAPFDIPQIWERNGCYQYGADFRSPTWILILMWMAVIHSSMSSR